MPAKDSSLITGDRQPTLTRKMYTQFKKENKELVESFDVFKKIVDTVNQVKADFVLEPTGYKVEYGGSVIIVNKYKSNKLLCDYNATKKYGKYIPYNNDHSFNYKHVIRWYSGFDKHFNFKMMMFYPCRHMKRELAQNIKNGTVTYQNWVKSDFYAVKHLQKLLN
jgi:hypothetical protein